MPTDGRCKHLSAEGKRQAQEKKIQDEAKQQAAKEEEDKKLMTNTRRSFFRCYISAGFYSKKDWLNYRPETLFP